MEKRKSKTSSISAALVAIRVLRANEARVKALYKRWQLLKLQTLGYTWGGYDHHNQPSITLIEHFYFEPMNESSWVGTLKINWARGGSAELPACWLDDPDWEQKATQEFMNYAMLKKLES